MAKVIAIVVGVCAIAIVVWLARRKSVAPPVTQVPTTTEPGRAAIDRALDRLYPDVLDHRMGLKPGDGEQQPPLEEVVAYHLPQQWLYVTYGLSELGAKISDDSARSGFGIELTLRLVDASETPPVWPINYLRWLAKMVWLDQNPYGEGHSLPQPGLLDTVSPHVAGAAFIIDPALGTVKTSNGSVKFLQVIPLRADEFDLISRWDANKLFAELRARDPQLLWRVDQPSILDGPRREEILREAQKDGSSQSVDFTSELAWDERGIQLDKLNRQIVLKFLRYRVHYGRGAEIHSEGKILKLEPGAFTFDGKSGLLRVPAERAQELAESLEKAAAGTTVSFEKHPLFVIR